MPRDLETICLKCLQKDPGRRYGSAAELAMDLSRWLEGRPITARPVASPSPWHGGAGNPLVAGLLAGVALLLVLATVGATSPP